MRRRSKPGLFVTTRDRKLPKRLPGNAPSARAGVAFREVSEVLLIERILAIRSRTDAIVAGMRHLLEDNDFVALLYNCGILTMPECLHKQICTMVPIGRAERSSISPSELGRILEKEAGLYSMSIWQLVAMQGYIRRLIGTKRLAAHLKKCWPEVLGKFESVSHNSAAGLKIQGRYERSILK